MEVGPPLADYPRGTEPTPADPKVTSAATWFFWVAGLSLVSMIMHATGFNFSFMVSMGVTEILGYVAVQSPSPLVKLFAWTVCIFVILVVGFCGYFSSRKFTWAFVVGIGILLLDCLVLFSMLPDSIPSILFRMWAVYALIGGFQALRAQKSRERLGQVVIDPSETASPGS